MQHKIITFWFSCFHAIKRSGLVLLILFVPSLVWAQSQWELKKSTDGIQVYTRSIPNSGHKALKAVLTAKGTTRQLAAILLNVALQKDWVYSTKSSHLVKQVSPLELIYYSEKSMPWPVTNRDAVIRLKISEGANGSMVVSAISVDGVVPEKKDIVRVPTSEVSWKVTQTDENTIKIEYEARIDPGGTLSPAVTNMFITKGPVESFKKLRLLLARQAS